MTLKLTEMLEGGRETKESIPDKCKEKIGSKYLTVQKQKHITFNQETAFHMHAFKNTEKEGENN